MDTSPRPSVTEQANSTVITFAIVLASAAAIGGLWMSARLAALLISAFVLLGGTKFLPKTERWGKIGDAMIYGTFLGTVVSFSLQLFYFGV
jgi:hypothetical protein